MERPTDSLKWASLSTYSHLDPSFLWTSWGDLQRTVFDRTFKHLCNTPLLLQEKAETPDMTHGLLQQNGTPL